MGEIHWAERIAIGALGGLLSVGTKFLAQDFARFQQFLEARDMLKMSNLAIGYGLVCFVIASGGALVAWVSRDETNRAKLLMLSVSAPALFTTWAAGGAAQLPPRVSFEIIPSAYAESATEQLGDPSIWDGIRLFFGGYREPLYRVVVGSYPDIVAAQAAVDRFNSMAPGIGARVGGKRLGNDFVSVVVSDYLPYKEATARLDEAKRRLNIGDAFIYPGP